MRMQEASQPSHGGHQSPVVAVPFTRGDYPPFEGSMQLNALQILSIFMELPLESEGSIAIAYTGWKA